MAENKSEQSKPLVLVVDDVNLNLKVVGKLLSKNGYKVSAAPTGKKALNLLKKIEPDLILLDIMMPGIDGFEVCEKIKNKEKTQDIPVIFLTGKNEEEDIAKGFAAGGVDYITKPFNKSELLARVNSHVELKKSKEKLQALNEELQEKLDKIQKLKGLVPICANCKKIRDDSGYWQEVEGYISDHSETEFSHGLCPDCMQELYPYRYERIREKKKNQKDED